MNHRKIYTIWTIAGIAIVVWLFWANDTIMKYFVPSDQRIEKTQLEEWLSKENKEVITVIENGTNTETLFETYILTGAAFCEDTGNKLGNGNRKVKLILSSGKNTYVINAANTTRVDIHSQFWGKKKMYGGTIGFKAEFSMLTIKDGIYNLYIFAQENEEVYGITDTGYQYIRDQYGLRKV